MPVLGTAGHVDHGKTSLIRALTGTDADRLPEEKRRGMTIDLGFAALDLDGVGRVSIVDVPGHERFLSNMLAGATGMDAALLCVAADDSVMAQTREHLAILELLPVARLVVALTRCDLADEQTREITAEEVRELLSGTRFAGAAVVETSAETGAGLDGLKSAIAELLASPEAPTGDWYLPIDRRFTVAGRGAVVTGTLAGGSVSVGEATVVQPGETAARVRGIESHGETLDRAGPGTRVALNLSGVSAGDLERGQTVGAPGAVFTTKTVDCRMTWRVRPRHAERVRVAIGADDALARVFHNDADEGLAQLRFESPVAAVRGQAVIVRLHSPPDLLGGGDVVSPQAERRRKTEAATIGSDPLDALSGIPAGMTADAIAVATGAKPSDLEAAGAIKLGELWVHPRVWADAVEKARQALSAQHEVHPQSAWLPRTAAGLPWKGKELDAALNKLAAEKAIETGHAGIRLPGAGPQLNPKQEAFLKRVEGALEGSFHTPNARDIATEFNVPPQAVEGILQIGVASERLVRLDGPIWYTAGQWQRLVELARSEFAGRDFRAAEFREAIQTSRKYAIPILERMDSTGVTARHGETRRIAPYSDG